MYLNVTELNELIYSLGVAETNGIFVNKEINNRLRDKLSKELEIRNAEVEEQYRKDEIEFEMNFKHAHYRIGEF